MFNNTPAQKPRSAIVRCLVISSDFGALSPTLYLGNQL